MYIEKVNNFIISFFHQLSKDSWLFVILLTYLNDKVHAFMTFRNWDSLLLVIYKMGSFTIFDSIRFVYDMSFILKTFKIYC